MLGPLVFFQRRFHQELQGVLLLVTRRLEITIVVFSILFFPGVLLHEISHWLMAKVLRVQTGGISLVPRATKDGQLQMGYVLTEKADIFRDALIGFAPLLTGGLFVGYAGTKKLGLLILWDAVLTMEIAPVMMAIERLLTQPDFWLWFYMTLVVSSTMLPSPADRRAWLPLLLMAALLIGTGVFLGVGPFIQDALIVPLNKAFRAIAVVLAISTGVHGFVLLPFWGVRKLLCWLTGLQVVA